MNSFTGNASHKTSTASPSTFSSYQFDFGLGSSTRNSTAPLKDQKLNPSSAPPKLTPAPTPSWAPQPNKPSWTHQPAPRSTPAAATAAALNGPTSMVGDILGKSWNATAPSNSTTSASLGIGIGIPKSNPNLFGDLVGSALNQGRSSGNNVPLKAAPTRNSFSTGNLSDSLPKSSSSNNSLKPGGWGSADNFGNFGGNGINSNIPMKSSWGSADNLGNFSSMNQSSKPMGGQPLNSTSGVGSNTKKDPFGSLMDFRSKNSGKAPINSSNSSNSPSFGAFQDAKPADFGMPAQQPTMNSSSFGAFQDAKPADFGKPAQQPAKAEDYSFGDFKNAETTSNFKQQASSDPLDSLFGSSGNSSGGQQFSEVNNDWDVGAEFGGQDHSEMTMELEGLPPPPNGVTSSIAKTKGMDNYKQGQFADAIKWLSWAVVLLEKSGDNTTDEVLICRASCYKEVGEYKKAVADCSKVLEHDSANVAVLLQRALLYESTEKYRLGADDLRMVLKIDPGNRLAKSTIHRLNKMAE